MNKSLLTVLFLVAAASVPAESLKVATFPYQSFVLLKIAVEEGFFRQQNLDVELVPLKSSNEVFPLLIKGTLDVAPTSLSAGLFSAISQGANLKIALPLNNTSVGAETSFAFVARKADVLSGKYRSAAGWKGAKVVTTGGARYSALWYFAATFLKTGGLGLADIESPAVDAALQPQAIATGQIDIATATEPALSRLLDRDELSILFPAEPLLPDFPLTVVVYGRRMLADRDLGDRFATAMLQAIRLYREGKTLRNIRYVAQQTGLDEAAVKAMRWSDVNESGLVQPRYILDYQNWLKDEKILDEVVPAEAFLDSGFALAAQKRLGKAR